MPDMNRNTNADGVGFGFDKNDRDAELDAILLDVKQLLDEDAEQIAQEADESAEPEAEAPEETPAAPYEQGAPVSADDVHIDYRKFYGETPPEPDASGEVSADEPVVFPPLTFYEQSRPAYQTARRAQYEREREQERLAREQELRAREQEEAEKMRELEQRRKKPRRAQRREAPQPGSADYAQWLYEQGSDAQSVAQRESMEAMQQEHAGAREKPVKKKRVAFGRVVLVLLAVLVVICVVLTGIARQPKAGDAALGARLRNCSTIFLAGVDEGGYRTDTMMLMRLDREAHTVSLVSIPRDTLVYCEYSVPKINSSYGWAGGGEHGMEELLKRVSEIIGFEPDGYILIEMSALEELIDRMGGVTFDVPMEMHYSDPSQNLSIDLSAGEQKLNGAQSLQLLRFRSGYAAADLDRVSVQRDFISAALKQWVSVRGAIALPGVLKLLKNSTLSSLSTANYLWLAETLMLCNRSEIHTATLPGAATYIAGGSYYVLDAAGVAETVNAECNPYEKGVTVSDLYIRVG